MKRSVISNRIRKQKNSSGQAECDICHEKDILNRHHINGRKVKKANLKWNTADICGSCHLRVHNGKIILEGWFNTDNGLILFWHYNNEDNNTGGTSDVYIVP